VEGEGHQGGHLPRWHLGRSRVLGRGDQTQGHCHPGRPQCLGLDSGTGKEPARALQRDRVPGSPGQLDSHAVSGSQGEEKRPQKNLGMNSKKRKRRGGDKEGSGPDGWEAYLDHSGLRASASFFERVFRFVSWSSSPLIPSLIITWINI